MPRPRGRPPATRGVFAVEDATLLLPGRVALDTSFVVRALIETQPLHEACSTFLDRLITPERVLISSDLLEVELAETAFSIALKERWGRDWWHRRADGRARRRADRLLRDVRTRYHLLTAAASHVGVPVAAVTDEAAALMTAYGLSSYDAVHAASAVAAGAEAIATTDTGFAALPSTLLVIYTDRSRVASCRERRPR